MKIRHVLVTPVRPVVTLLQKRIDTTVHAAEDRHERRLAEVTADLLAQKDAESAEQHRMRELRLAEVGSRIDDLDDQVRRIGVQLVELERRVGELERPAVDLDAEPADRRAARSLLDEVRVEHQRTRAELATIAFYEERIARLEGAQLGSA